MWNAHTSVGNILGSAVAAACLSWGWGWAFLIPGAALAFTGVIIWLFLVVEPEEAGLMKMRDSLVVSLPSSTGLGWLQHASALTLFMSCCIHPVQYTTNPKERYQSPRCTDTWCWRSTKGSRGIFTAL